MTQPPKTPKGKATFKAIDPDGNVHYRSSARDYTHACAIYWPAEAERIHQGNGSVIAAKPAHWGVVSFNGSEALALKSASQFRATTFRAVPVEVVEDRRGV